MLALMSEALLPAFLSLRLGRGGRDKNRTSSFRHGQPVVERGLFTFSRGSTRGNTTYRSEIPPTL